MKKLQLFLVLAMLLIQPIYGQRVPIRTSIQTPRGRVTTSYYSPSSNYSHGGNAGVQSPKFDYVIVFKNDSTIKKFTKINLEDSIHTLNIKVKGEKYIIKPTDTKSITFTSSITGLSYIGIPNDSCWLFKVEKGRISSYAFEPENNILYIVAFQYGTGPVLGLTKENLEPIIKNNEKAMKFLNKGQLNRAIKIFNE